MRRRAFYSVPEVALVAERLAKDEDRHTDLAWRIVEWCKTEGGAPVDKALAKAMRRLSAGELGAAQDRLVNTQRRLPPLVPSR